MNPTITVITRYKISVVYKQYKSVADPRVGDLKGSRNSTFLSMLLKRDIFGTPF